MFDEGWDQAGHETRILFMYREYDAITNLMATLTGNDSFFNQLKGECQALMQAICREQPVQVLDLAAQSVIMAQLGSIDVPASELARYLDVLNSFIVNGEVESAVSDKLVPFAAFWQKLVSKAAAETAATQMRTSYHGRRPTRIWG